MTTSMCRFSRAVQAAGLVAAVLLGSPRAGAGGFFDDVPRKSYVRDDVALDVLSVDGRDGTVVARIRYLRLVLDPGRSGVATDLWPQREMILVERASGERLVFERLSGIPPSADADALAPRGRLAVEGAAVETFLRTGTGACAALDGLIRTGQLDLPFALEDLPAPTVRRGIAQAIGAALDARDLDVVGDTIPILLRAESQGIPLSPLKVLDLVLPGRIFARSAASLTFRVSAAVPPDPAAPPWSSMTQAPELIPGVPAF
ncbi:MAG TPA: hypothetical protein PK598_05680 [Thermoanaerobaculia bacterium]|nr:hypothetical protein [Thermoanaerobaculia bacterium]